MVVVAQLRQLVVVRQLATLVTATSSSSHVGEADRRLGCCPVIFPPCSRYSSSHYSE